MILDVHSTGTHPQNHSNCVFFHWSSNPNDRTVQRRFPINRDFSGPDHHHERIPMLQYRAAVQRPVHSDPHIFIPIYHALLLIFFTLLLLPPNSSQPCKTCQTQQKSTQKVLNPNQAVNNVNAKQKPTVLPSPTKNLVVPNRRIGKKPILLGWVKPVDQFHGKISTPLLTVYCLPCKIVHFSFFFLCLLDIC